MKNIAVIGTGAYGIALASIFDENKCFVTMWTKFENEKEEILTKRSNERVLPGFRISDTINITTDIKECVKDGVDIEKTKQEIKEKVDPAKWICVQASSVIVESKDNVIILIMLDNNDIATKMQETFKNLD